MNYLQTKNAIHSNKRLFTKMLHKCYIFPHLSDIEMKPLQYWCDREEEEQQKLIYLTIWRKSENAHILCILPLSIYLLKHRALLIFFSGTSVVVPGHIVTTKHKHLQSCKPMFRNKVLNPGMFRMILL